MWAKYNAIYAKTAQTLNLLHKWTIAHLPQSTYRTVFNLALFDLA